MRNFLQAPKWHVLASAFVLMSACNNPEQQVGVRIISILVTPQGAVILAGATAQLNAVLTVDGDITKAVTWTSSDPSIAVVNSSGLVAGIKAGTAIVRAQSNADPNFNATADITVKAPVTGVAVSPATASVAVGSIQPLTVTVTADQTISNLAVTWSTSNAAVATVSTAGVVTGVAAGAVTITASANAYPSATGSAAIVITPSLFGAINGNYTGKMTLTTNAATPGTLGGLPTCVGVGTEYSEAVAILLNSAGMGTATFTDTKDFPRAYSIAMSAAFSATASGTFPYFASNVPGWMSVTVTGKTAKFRETTQYGTCADSFEGILSTP